MHARNIALYASGTTNFDTQGLGILRDALTCESTETAATNGNITYTLELTYPIGGYLADQLTNGNLIRAQVGSSSDDYMIFEIVNNVKADSGTITVYADAYPYRILRMSFDNGGIFGKYSSVQDALTAIKSEITDFPSNFQLISGVGTSIDLTQAASTSASSSTTVANQQPTSWATFGDALNEIMNQISGQVEYGVNYIRIYSVRGADVNTTMLRDDKNTNGVSIKTDTENIVNRIIPMIPVIGDDGNATGAYKVGSVVTSSVANNWINFWSAKVVQVTDQDYANNYFNITSCDRPTLTATVTTSMLDQDLSDVHLFDRLTVYSKRINYAAKLQISTRVFDNLTGEVSSFSLGSSAVTVFTQQQTTVNQIASLLQDTQYAIASANGKNTNYYGGTNPPANPSEGDYWFVKIDGVSYIKQYQAGNWEIVVSDATQDQIKQTVAQAVADGQDALTKANTAVDTANTANSNSQSAISAAQSASDNANNATTVANNAISQATSASTVANNVSQEIVTLKGGSTATLAELENGLALKLSTSDFNTQMANYATQTWTTNQITATSDSLSSTISSVQTQVNNSAVGTNLITGTSMLEDSNWIWDSSVVSFSNGTILYNAQNIASGSYSDVMHILTSVDPSTQYTLSWNLEYQGSPMCLYVVEYKDQNNTTASYQDHALSLSGSYNSSDRKSMTFTTQSDCGYLKLFARCFAGSDYSSININFKLEKGSVATDYSANPADNATVISVSNLTQTVDSLSTVVSGKVDNTTYTSKVTELANSIATKVESSDYNSKMTQLDNAISAKVSSADYNAQVTILTNQINSKVSQSDLKVGGENYLLSTNDWNTVNWNQSNPSTTSISSGIITIDATGISSGYYDVGQMSQSVYGSRQYTLSWNLCWLSASGGCIVYAVEYKDQNNVTASYQDHNTFVPNDPYRNSITFTTQPDCRYLYVIIRSLAGYKVQIQKLMLTDGNLNTGWHLNSSEIANYSQIQQLSDNINLRVAKNDVVNQINISTEGILIAGEKVHITGSTTIDDAAIGSAKISTLSASKVTGGTLDFSQITATNINANSITAGTLTGVAFHQSSAGHDTWIDQNGIHDADGNGNNAWIQKGILQVYDSDSNGFFMDSGKIELSSYSLWQNSQTVKYGLIELDNNIIGLAKNGMHLQGTSGVSIDTVSSQFNAFSTSSLVLSDSNGAALNMADDGRVLLGGHSNLHLTGGSLYSIGSVTNSFKPTIDIGSSEWIPTGAVNNGRGQNVIVNANGIYLESGGETRIAPHGDLWLGSAHINTGSNSNSLWSGPAGGWWMRDYNGNMTTVHCQSVSQSSLLSLKTNLSKLDGATALAALISTDICSYNYKSDLKNGISKTYATAVIDDVNDKPQYSLPYDFISADGTGRDDGTILGYAVSAIKELNSIIDSLKTEIKALKGE